MLAGEAGLTYVKDENIDNTSSSYLGGRAFGQYTYAFTEKNKFSQSLEDLMKFKDSNDYTLN